MRYQLNFYLERPEFVPIYKYINEWGRKNRKGGITLSYYLVEWLDENISDYKGELSIETTTYDDEVLFEMTNEVSYMQLLAEISAVFRTLAAEHGNTSKDSYDNYGYNAILSYNEKDFADVHIFSCSATDNTLLTVPFTIRTEIKMII